MPAQTWEPGGGDPSVYCANVYELRRRRRTAGCARTAGQHVPTVIAGRRPQRRGRRRRRARVYASL